MYTMAWHSMATAEPWSNSFTHTSINRHPDACRPCHIPQQSFMHIARARVLPNESVAADGERGVDYKELPRQTGTNKCCNFY